MMLAHGNMRVSHRHDAHVRCEDVPKRVTPERLRRVIDLTHDALMRLGAWPRRASRSPRSTRTPARAACSAGRTSTSATPVIDEAVAAGRDVVGPVPGDTVFVKLRAGQYDAVVAMYHDQGHIPVKLLGFEIDPATGKWQDLSGVNITLGLPIIRTSVDHGTAFDIAGKGIANEQSLIEAIEYAERLAALRRARPSAQHDPASRDRDRTPEADPFRPGRGARGRRLRRAHGRTRPLVVSDPFNAGRVDVLRAAGRAGRVRPGTPEPDMPEPECAASRWPRTPRPDLVVGFGGGSAMDLGQARGGAAGERASDPRCGRAGEGGRAPRSLSCKSPRHRAPAARPARARW